MEYSARFSCSALKSGVIVVPLFFLLASFLTITTPLIFNSPDETAAYFFSKRLIETGRLTYPEPLNQVSAIVYPRSMNLKGTDLVPGSFIGLMLLLGLAGKLFGTNAIIWVVPIMTSFGLVAFIYLVRMIFDEKVATYSAWLWLFHPAILYYSARGLLPNMAFISLVLIAASLIAYKHNHPQERLTLAGAAGLVMGLAIAVRPSELLWLAPVIAIYFCKDYQKWSRREIFSLAFGALVALSPAGYYQQITFGQPWLTGYQELNQPVISADRSISSMIPFSFNLKGLLKNTFDYLFKIFIWLTIPLMVLVMTGFKDFSIGQRWYLRIGVLMSVILVLFYGSYQFVDSTLSGPTIGTSYVRYWLPIYIWSIPLIAKLLSVSAKLIPALLLIGYLGIGQAFFFTPESLVSVRNNLHEYQGIQDQVFNLTEPNSIVVTWRTDKIFFPGRRVINLRPDDFSRTNDIGKLAKSVPVYLYSMESKNRMVELNDNQFRQAGWQLEERTQLGKFRLYQVVNL